MSNSLEQDNELLKNRLKSASAEIIRTGNENLDLKEKIRELTQKVAELERKVNERLEAKNNKPVI